MVMNGGQTESNYPVEDLAWHFIASLMFVTDLGGLLKLVNFLGNPIGLYLLARCIIENMFGLIISPSRAMTG